MIDVLWCGWAWILGYCAKCTSLDEHSISLRHREQYGMSLTMTLIYLFEDSRTVAHVELEIGKPMFEMCWSMRSLILNIFKIYSKDIFSERSLFLLQTLAAVIFRCDVVLLALPIGVSLLLVLFKRIIFYSNFFPLRLYAWIVVIMCFLCVRGEKSRYKRL